MSTRFSGLQQLGRALMLPIAVLPIAGLLLRLGQPDLLGWAAMAAAGDAIFSNLGLLFAVGVGVGLARENNGAAGLAALVGFLVTTHAIEALMAVPPQITANLAGAARDLALSAFKTRELAKLSIPVGLLSGIIAGVGYNRFSDMKLPSYLTFFGGRRFVPIVSGVVGLALAAVLGFAWPVLEHGMDATSNAILGAGSFGLFAYGLLNRILIVTGLHHILNNFAWFIVGDYHGATGDLKRYFAGDPSAGAFMSGFFPVMMFGLPGACLAMYHTARPEAARRNRGSACVARIDFVSDRRHRADRIHVHVPRARAVCAPRDCNRPRDGPDGRVRNSTRFQFFRGPVRLLAELQSCAASAAAAADRRRLFRSLLRGVSLLHRAPESCNARAEKPMMRLSARRRRWPPTSVPTRSSPHSAEREISSKSRLARRACVSCSPTTELIDERALKRLGARGVIRAGAQGLQVVLGPEADQVAGHIRDSLRRETTLRDG